MVNVGKYTIHGYYVHRYLPTSLMFEANAGKYTIHILRVWKKYPIVASRRTTQNVPSNHLEQNGWTLLIFQYEIVGVSPPILGYLHVFCFMTCK